MSTSGQNVKHHLQILGHSLDQEQEEWLPVVHADSQTMEQRPNILTWLMELNAEFGFCPDTVYLAIDILDRFLHSVRAQPKYLKCVALTCLYLASKVDEEDEVIPSTTELVGHSYCQFSLAEVMRMERCILTKLNWNLKPYKTWMEFLHLWRALLVSKCPTVASLIPHSSLVVLDRCLWICQLNNDLLSSWRPSAIALALLSLYLEHTWVHWLAATKTLQALARLSDEEMTSCRELVDKCAGAYMTRLVALDMCFSSPLFITSPSRPVAHPEGGKTAPFLTSSTSSPITPPAHPPAKRRRLTAAADTDDDVVVAIRHLYGDVTSDDDVMLSVTCASEMQRVNGVTTTVPQLVLTA
jgi:hypothetical protein